MDEFTKSYLSKRNGQKSSGGGKASTALPISSEAAADSGGDDFTREYLARRQTAKPANAVPVTAAFRQKGQTVTERRAAEPESQAEAYIGPAWAQDMARRRKPSAVPASPTAQWEQQKQEQYRKLYPEADWGQIAGGTALLGLDKMAIAGGTTLAAAEGLVTRPLGYVLGNPELYKEGIFYHLNEGVKRETEANQEKYHQEYAKAGKTGELLEKFGPATVAALPQAALAYLTAGQSLMAQQTTGALELASEAAQAAGKGARLAQTVTEALKATGANPSFQYSLLNTIGGEYEQAKADGADELHAYAYAALAGLMNSVVEVGGGLDVLPEGGKSGVREWVDTMLDEGKEEVIQGAISQLAQAVVYGKDNPLFSMTDQEAVINPSRAAEEFAGGAVVGGILGGGQIAVNKALGSLSTPGDTGIPLETETPATGPETASGGAVESGSVQQGDNTLVKQIRQSLPEISGMDAVADIKGNELPAGSRIVDRLVGFVNAIGNKVNRPGFGDVLFSRGRIKSSMIGHGAGPAKIETFAAVPAVIRSGVQIDYQQNWKGRGYDTYTFAAPVNYRGGRSYLGVIVTKDVSDGRYYVHEVVDESGGLIYQNKEAAAPTSDGRASPKGTVDTVVSSATPNTTIPQEAGAVNGETDSRAELYMRRLERRGVEPVQAENMGMWLAKIERGGQLTAVQEQMIEGEPEAAAVLAVLRARNETKNTSGGGLNGQETGAQPQSGGNDLYDGDGRRVPGVSTGGEAGSLAGTAEGRINPDQLRTAGERQNRVHALRPEPVSTRELGLTTGTEEATVMLVPREAYDTKLWETERSFRAAGYQATFVIGQLRVDTRGGAARVNGAVQGNRVYIRADDPNWTVDQIANHERFHIEAARDPQLVGRVREKILSRFSEEQFNKVVDTYIRKLRGIIDIPENGSQAERDAALVDILEEIFADAYGDKNAFTTETARYTETVREAVRERSGTRPQETAAATERTTGPPAERYSYAGSTAKDSGESGNSIVPNMDEEARAEILRGKTVGIPSYNSKNEVTGQEIIRLKALYTARAGDIFKVIAEKCGVFGTYRNEDVGLTFDYTRRSMQESKNKQITRGGSAEDFGKMLTVLPDIIGGAVEVEAHTDQYAGTRRHDERLKEMHVLLGAFRDGSDVIPVQLEIKEFREDVRQKNKLYVTITMKTKEAGITPSPASSNSEGLVLGTPASKASVADIASLVKDDSGSLVKYLPDSMLSEDQRAAKRAALTAREEKLEDMRYEYAVERGDLASAENMLRQKAAERGYTGDDSWRMNHKAPKKGDDTAVAFHQLDQAYGEDIYGRQAADWYGDGYDFDQKAAAVIRRAKGDPDAMVDVYRAVPKTVQDTHLRNGDWVTITREYAVMHGSRELDGDFRIIREKVPAKYLYGNGDSIHEYGYDNGRGQVYQNAVGNAKETGVTYDDGGKLIPLSERYNTNNADPRYSAEGAERRKTARDTLRQKLEEMFPAGKGSKREMNTLIRDVIDGEGTSLSTQERMDRAFNTLLETARVQDAVDSDAAEIAGELRGRRIYVPAEVKSEFGDNWNSVQRQAMGAGIYLVNDASAPGVDTVFAELSARFGGPFAESVTDRAAMIETMLRAAQNARGGEITLLEEARRLGGEGSEDSFRTTYRAMFDTAVEAYRTELLNISAEEKAQRLADLDQRQAKLREYIENARETLRRRAVETGESVPPQALGPDSTGKPRSIDDYLAEKAAEAEAARTKRLRNIPKTEFEGTENLRKIGVRIEGTVTDYWGAESMRKSEASLRLIRNEIKRAEKRLRATPAEKKFASDMVAGVYSQEFIPAKMDRETVMELADYYMAERAMDTGMIRQKKQDISRLLDERMAALFKDSDRYKPSSAAVLNHRTPQRNMLKIFGDQQGRIINQAVFDPVSVNEAERIRWTNRQFDQVRTFPGKDGKASALNKAERAAVQNTIEGKALEEMLAGMELGESIKRVGENIHNNPDSLQNYAWEFALRPSEEKLAQRYARWLGTKEALDSGKLDSVKVENAARKYTRMFDDYYEAINDFLVSHGYDPIGFIKGYAPHLQPEETANLLDKALRSLGVNTDVTTLPTAIAGQTADFKPGKKWNPYFLTRQTDTAQADIVAGFESYVQYLGEVLYHTDDIMRVRRMSEHIRKTYAPEELRVAIEQAEDVRWRPLEEKEAFLRDRGELPRGETATAEKVSELVEDYITKQFKAIDEKKKYGTLVPWLDNYANILAGKQSLADRGSEYGMGRGILNVGNRLTRIFARAQVAGNLSSALNQTSQLPQIIAENGAVNTAEALGDMISGKLRKAGFAQESDLLTGKDGIHFIAYTPGDMVMNVLFTPAGWADTMVSTLAVRGAYLKAVKSGMSHQAAMKAADSFATNIMGSRAKGSRPLAFESKNPVSQMAHVFQLEVLNSWEHLSQDLPRDFREIQQTYGKDKAVAALVGVIVKALLSAFVLNRLSEETYGGTPAPFDLLGLTSNFIASGQGLTTNRWIRTVLDNGLEKLTGSRLFQTEDADRGSFDVGTAFGELGGNILNDVPFVRNVSGLMGLGDQTLPWPDIYGGVSDVGKAVAADGLFSGRTAEELFDLAVQLIPGGRQISKTVKGAATMARGGRVYGWGDKAKLQYPVENSPLKWGQALLFGTNALEESRAYWLGGGEGGLTAKQTAQWTELTENGADGHEAFDAIKEVSEADGWLAKVREIAEAPWNDDMKEMLLEDSISETQYKRWRAAQRAGVKLITYTDFLDRAHRAARKRTGKDSASPSQEDVVSALKSTKLTDRQRTAIWDSFGWKRESPWG